jgi:hypothetical protein
MVTITFILATVVMPISAAILAILLFPWTPGFVLKKFSRYLWDLSLTINGFRFKLVHLMLIFSAVMTVAKANSYYEALYQFDGEIEHQIAVDYKMKMNRAGRDFFIICNLMAIWIYIWRFIPLVSRLVN